MAHGSGYLSSFLVQSIVQVGSSDGTLDLLLSHTRLPVSLRRNEPTMTHSMRGVE